MRIYIGKKDVGEIKACSMYEPKGSSFVHLDKKLRQKLGLTSYDEFFGTLKEAYDWLHEKLPDAGVAGCEYDMYTGQVMTMSELIGE